MIWSLSSTLPRDIHYSEKWSRLYLIHVCSWLLQLNLWGTSSLEFDQVDLSRQIYTTVQLALSINYSLYDILYWIWSTPGSIVCQFCRLGLVTCIMKQWSIRLACGLKDNKILNPVEIECSITYFLGLISTLTYDRYLIKPADTTAFLNLIPKLPRCVGCDYSQ